MVVPLDSVPGASACPIGEDTRRRPPSTSDLGAQTVRASTVGGHGVATGKTCHHIGHFSHTSPAGTPPTHRPRPSESPRPAPPMHQTRAALKAKVRKSRGQQYVGIDLHRRRSVIVRTTEAGEVLEAVRIAGDVERLASVMDRAGQCPEVVLEATYGWYWAVDALQAGGANVHLAHPLGVKAFEYRRVKNDFRDAQDLADLLRMGRLPEAWIAPPPTRELRELVRHRAKLVGLRSHCKAEVHAVLAKCGVQVLMS